MCSQRPEKGAEFLGTGVVGDCKLPHVVLRTDLRSSVRVVFAFNN